MPGLLFLMHGQPAISNGKVLGQAGVSPQQNARMKLLQPQQL